MFSQISFVLLPDTFNALKNKFSKIIQIPDLKFKLSVYSVHSCKYNHCPILWNFGKQGSGFRLCHSPELETLI